MDRTSFVFHLLGICAIIQLSAEYYVHQRKKTRRALQRLRVEENILDDIVSQNTVIYTEGAKL